MVHTVVAYATMAWPLEHCLVSWIRNAMWASRVFIDSIFALIECSRFSKRPSVMHRHVRAWWAVSKRNATWLILPVVICLSQRLSHACIIAIVGLQRGIPSKRESSARVDYVPALCTHRPSLLPIEWSGEVFRIAATWAVRRRRRRENSTEPYHLEEGEVVTRFP
ncbi:hypothetical protein L2E82_51760 [Cichorium intybus]|nr:hypothetical protein L2E82_51760 [Cichorium intybus]